MLTPSACCKVYYSLYLSPEVQVDCLLYRYAGEKGFKHSLLKLNKKVNAIKETMDASNNPTQESQVTSIKILYTLSCSAWFRSTAKMRKCSF